MNKVTCILRGHSFRSITHDRSMYRYCLRCGKVEWRHSHITLRRPVAGKHVIQIAVG